MRYFFLSLIFLFTGCVLLPQQGMMSEYINRVDHPYDRKFYAGIEKVTSSLMYVLKGKGWAMSSEANPATYERDDRYDNNGYQNLLIMTNTKSHYSGLSRTYTHLNVLIHSIGNVSDVEIRYEAITPLIKQFTSTRSDKEINAIFDAVEQEISR